MSFEVSKILLAFLVLINPLAALTIYLDATADYTRRVLEGDAPVPESIARQVHHITTIAARL